ncbi:hypothetical protein [Desulfospira joergensenii]|uniref:hypothetical protein n=1 Tax=Desulfospira joergensenii TaxID=53329 RepID=UPI0004104FC6|nr:hypothetical protein [Desulfospira joergensenii]
MSVSHRSSFLTAILFCLLLVQAGCVRVGPQPEHAIVTPHIGDQGISGIQRDSRNSIFVPAGLSKSAVSQGSVFVYDNPAERWEATALDDQNITWRNSKSDTKLTSLSMILPALRWEGERKSGRRMITAMSGNLHPLKKGNKIRFREEVFNTRPPGEYSGVWECEVQGRVEVVVPAGKFNTWQILCKRNRREHILLNYAEELGNNVRTIRVPENNSTPVVRRLIAVSPMPAGRNRADGSGKNKK